MAILKIRSTIRALEAIKIKQKSNTDYKGEIMIKIYATETTVQSTEFNEIRFS